MSVAISENLNSPCNTVGAHLAKVSLNSTDPVLCIEGRYRRFTPREVARIQSFPDSFNLTGSERNQYKALGNAIPPVLAWHVMDAFISTIKKSQLLNPQSETQPTPHETHCNFIQSVLFDPGNLYLINKTPITLLGTYRRTCKDWILENNLYNYPITDKELDDNYEYLAVRRLILQRKKDEMLYFSVQGYSIVTKKELSKLGYKINKKRPSKTKYILYTLERLKEPIPKFDENAICLVGKGIK